MQFAINISEKPVTWKQGQGHQIYNDNVGPKQAYNHAKFDRSHLKISLCPRQKQR